MKTYTAEISISKKDEHSFLVALIPALSIPSQFHEDRDIMESDCAVIAANHCGDGKNLWAYVHLERDEKQTIGEALRDSCVEMGKWYWCNLYAQGADEIEAILARHNELVEAVKKEKQCLDSWLEARMFSSQWKEEDANRLWIAARAEVDRLLQEPPC